MRDGIAITAALTACTAIAFNFGVFFPRRRAGKRVSFSTREDMIHDGYGHHLTEEERKDLSYSPAELQQFSRSLDVDAWLEEWGS
ncbi:expressed unknown protein [Ectocarpus siliculosus]|uniref:Uncharacterized protein n=1 Tax=Ectocarpus siliculosus TaxID=2880 RepID=D7FLL3_ECTSI|nr:expressed unknown protein [Ectocarpus siliculosus]|eukprot:CBJ25829.1 expressed unknown protein [Ectocarpus siliculosus]